MNELECPACDSKNITPALTVKGFHLCNDCETLFEQEAREMDDGMDAVETQRQVYLAELAHIIETEKLTSAEATQLMYGEIASWLMVITGLLIAKTGQR